MYISTCVQLGNIVWLFNYLFIDLYAYGVKRIMDFRQQSSVTSKYNPVLTYTTLSGIQFTMPVHLDMTEFSARHDSLNRIPETSRRYLKLDEMAEAGLFYQGTNNINWTYFSCAVRTFWYPIKYDLTIAISKF